MPGTKLSGRKPNLANTDAKNLDRRKRAKQAKENNKDFSGIGLPPAHLSRSGKLLFKNIVKEFSNKNLLTKLDRPLLVLFCENVDLSRMAQEDITKNGIISSEDGKIKANPAVAIKNNADKQIKSIGSSLGLDPMSRANLLSNQPVVKKKEEGFDLMSLVNGSGTNG